MPRVFWGGGVCVCVCGAESQPQWPAPASLPGALPPQPRSISQEVRPELSSMTRGVASELTNEGTKPAPLPDPICPPLCLCRLCIPPTTFQPSPPPNPYATQPLRSRTIGSGCLASIIVLSWLPNTCICNSCTAVYATGMLVPVIQRADTTGLWFYSYCFRFFKSLYH